MGGMGNMGGFGFEDIFNEMFGGAKRSAGDRMGPQASVMNMTIDFNESVFGATKVSPIYN